MTEDQAKTKWCAYSGVTMTEWRVSGVTNPLGNCIGAACMQWRQAWRGTRDKTAVIYGENAPQGWTEEGYCGLAGRP